jgi:hypothetical protein
MGLEHRHELQGLSTTAGMLHDVAQLNEEVPQHGADAGIVINDEAAAERRHQDWALVTLAPPQKATQQARLRHRRAGGGARLGIALGLGGGVAACVNYFAAHLRGAIVRNDRLPTD